jgi:23S rRNA pseudouridine2605 synthase
VGAQKTLERVISKAGLGSRTQARSWIHAKRVRVNGQVVENPDHWIDFDRDRVEFDGKPLRIREKVYLLVNKPTGYITTFKDPEGRPTVYDLLGAVETFVSPVGRLDLDTSGLLIMTNDTQLAERLTNPDHHVPKTYRVECDGAIPEESIRLLRNGVELNDGPTRPAAVKRLGGSEASTTLEIVLTEGRNRQVRRMIEAIGSKVVALTRTQIGSIAIGQLAAGEWRPLTPVELDRLQRERN